MGFLQNNPSLEVVQEGIYKHSDRFSKVFYKLLSTPDGIQVPAYGVFTLPPTEDNHAEGRLCGIVSDDYKFSGNESLVEGLKTSIGNALFREKHYLNSPYYTSLRSELIISNPQTVRSVGDIHPQVVVENSYNGKRKVLISFGLMINDGRRETSFSFKDKLVTYSQVHIESARTRSTEIGQYVNSFNANIQTMVAQNLASTLSEDDVMDTLDLIEKLGKRKRESISAILQEMRVEAGQISSWQMFLAISKYSTEEKNLNVKTLIENMAERVLIVPTAMMRMTEQRIAA